MPETASFSHLNISVHFQDVSSIDGAAAASISRIRKTSIRKEETFDWMKRNGKQDEVCV